MIADLPPDERSEAFKRNMVTASVMMATTVVIIDMTIATIALPHMQGGLSASQDQVSWVMTTYFMMQAITMSATGWLAGRFGRKKLYIFSLIGFAICSVLSGNATSIEEIMIYRGLQGMFSAPVVPISQALMLDSYPRERHAQAMSIWGMGVMFAPVMGPVIGGWLTDEYSWRWVFYVSMPFSLLGILGAIFFIRETPKNLERRFDIFGFIALAIALAATQFMLDRGEGEGWFGSDLIVATAVIIGLALYLFVAHSTTTKNPFITPAILTDRNYMLGLFFMFLLLTFLLYMISKELQRHTWRRLRQGRGLPAAGDCQRLAVSLPRACQPRARFPGSMLTPSTCDIWLMVDSLFSSSLSVSVFFYYSPSADSIGGDIGPRWQSVLGLVDINNGHAAAAGPGSWNDMDSK